VPSSQLTTASRKLAIMIPTPMAADTAIISAAMATEVRENAATMPRAASRPTVPNPAAIGGWSSRSSPSAAAGATSAEPIMSTNSPANPPTIPAGRASTRAPPATSPAPIHVARVTIRRALVSSAPRLITTRGGAPVASRAGASAAASVAPTPRSTPLASTRGSSVTSRTESTK
jgi:hypothetical protein